ncbi:nitroreductase family protein [Candidatus Lokiarchaeum ossiferum]|uniref:nitroreductase family protein n=1 Tax=Candidatus Lokiarchaeum ossiferum TaxID=2951803 RepID=UPI00352BD814
MPILGLQQEKCTKCMQCVKECPAFCFRYNQKTRIIEFDNSNNSCILCGHCIACCPVEVINYAGMEEPTKLTNSSEMPTYDQLHSMFRQKRSIRHYKPEALSPEDLKKVTEAMKYGPTGSNIRDMKVTIISDSVKIRELSKGVVETLLKSPDTSDNYRQLLKYKQSIGLDPIFFKAPHVVIISSKVNYDIVNATIATTYGMLAAHSLQLGTCWIGLAYMAFLANQDLREKTAQIEGKIWNVFTLGIPDIKFYRSPPRPSIV